MCMKMIVIWVLLIVKVEKVEMISRVGCGGLVLKSGSAFPSIWYCDEVVVLYDMHDIAVGNNE